VGLLSGDSTVLEVDSTGVDVCAVVADGDAEGVDATVDMAVDVAVDVVVDVVVDVAVAVVVDVAVAVVVDVVVEVGVDVLRAGGAMI